jgi:hypothetical protein
MSDYPDSGALFKNNYKDTERKPDYKGDGEYRGVKFEMAAWIKEGRNGKFLSVKFSEPYRKEKQTSPLDSKEAPNMMKQADNLYANSENDGDLPF